MSSACVSANNETSSASDHEPPSASEKLVEGLETAMSIISDILHSSSDAMATFKSDWDAALTSYQFDVGRIDEEMERATARESQDQTQSAQRTKEGAAARREQVARTEADHALNFHLRSKDVNPNDGSDVFMLPTDEAEVEIVLLPDEANAEKMSDTKSDVAKGGAHSKMKSQAVTDKEDEESARFASVANLITQMQAFRSEEEELLNRLREAQPKDNGMTAPTLQERRELENRLEQCRSRQTQQVVASMTTFKPKFKASSGKTPKSSHLGLNLIPIEDVLQDAVASALPVATTDKTDPKVKPHQNGSKAKRQRQEPRHRKHVRKTDKDKSRTLNCSKGGSSGNERKTPEGHGVTRDSRAARAPERAKAAQQVLRDPDNLLTIHELPTANTTSKRSESVSRPLSALITSNTRPSSAMEMGRRSKTGK